MTTIVFDGKTMASDSRRTCGETLVSDKVQKLHNVEGDVIGCAGNSDDAELFLKWYKRRHLGIVEDYPTLESSFTALVWAANGVYIWHDKDAPYKMEPPCAIGSGSIAARGALAVPHVTAEQAVRAAMQVDVFSGGEVQVMRR